MMAVLTLSAKQMPRGGVWTFDQDVLFLSKLEEQQISISDRITACFSMWNDMLIITHNPLISLLNISYIVSLCELYAKMMNRGNNLVGTYALSSVNVHCFKW